jgi:hypothetical protein
VLNCSREHQSKAQAWVHTLVTDDDASTRANVKWNLKDYYDQKLGKGNWTKKRFQSGPELLLEMQGKG